MPLQLVRNDITKVECDAIVNAANPTLLGGGGVDGAIHRAAGNELLEECRALGGCKVGEAKITAGYKLPSKFVIHTVGPVWQGGKHNEEALLEACYTNSLMLAKAHSCESVAFPVISSGVYGYPMNEALKVAIGAISAFLLENDMFVYLVVYNKQSVIAGNKLFENIREYIDDNYVELYADKCRSVALPCGAAKPAAAFAASDCVPCDEYSVINEDLSEIIDKTIDESFSEMLLRKIDEKGITDSECYKKANIDRKLFSKIRSNPQYKPKKVTAIAFAIALELPLEETKDMLNKAGFSLSHSNKFDIIIEYFISNGNYNIFEINEALFAFDQSLLGV